MLSLIHEQGLGFSAVSSVPWHVTHASVAVARQETTCLRLTNAALRFVHGQAPRGWSVASMPLVAFLGVLHHSPL